MISSLHVRCQATAIVVVALWSALLCIGAPYPDDLWLQHAPTVVALVALAWAVSRSWLSDGAFAAAFGFLMLHALGARYVYTFVPYDEWTRRFVGVELTSTFELHRNHYDRVVHFAFGLLVSWPLLELLERVIPLRRAAVCWLSAVTVIALAALYELGEWTVALIFAPERADRYLGQQGDPWDAHRDMALAVLGTAITMTILAFTRGSRERASDQAVTSS